MIQWVKSLWKKPEAAPPMVRTSKDGENLSPSEVQYAEKGKCPDCLGALLAGPEGGCSVNFYCDVCQGGFNLTFMMGSLVFAERITDTKMQSGGHGC